MALSNDLISQFVKATRDNDKSSNEVTTYGEIKVDEDGKKSIKLDGSDSYVPLTNKQLTVSVIDKDRVNVTIKNHTLCVTGNLTHHSASAKSVDEANGKISEFDRMLANTVSVEQLAAERARIDSLVAENLVVNEELEAASAIILELQAKDADITGKLTAAEGDISKLKTDKLDSNTAKITYATIKELDAAKADIYNLNAAYGEFVELTTNTFEAVNGDIENLKTNKLDAHTASITYATIVDLKATNGSIDILESDVADINTLMFGSATGNVLQTSFANAVVAQLGNAQIKSAMIESIAASKITSGDIITNNVRVKSEDGSLLISDETVQISDGTRVRVQIGKDASNDYSINIWDSDGKLMFSEGGISDSAIKEAIIRNDMVSDTANIAAHKLDIDSLFEEINDSTNTIKSTKVYLDDEKQTLDVAFTSLSTSVTDMGKTVSSQGTAISAIQGQISSKIWQQDIVPLSTSYSELTQTVGNISATVASHTSGIESATSRVSDLEIGLDGFKSSVKDTYAEKDDVQMAQSTADTAQETARIAETLIQQLSQSIAMLVTDGKGTSLMTQTEDGWTFSTSDIQTNVSRIANDLHDLTDELGSAVNTIDVLTRAVNDLGEIAEYVKIGTYDNEPCIELGESDSEFKMRITNTRILFMEGSNTVAYISNQSLNIKKAVIEDELQQGGFVWKVRSNGNMGLIWKGVGS